jgi:hypothetical protein
MPAQLKKVIENVTYKPKSAIVVYETYDSKAPETMKFYLEYGEIVGDKVRNYNPLRTQDLSKLYFFLKSQQLKDKPRC